MELTERIPLERLELLNKLTFAEFTKLSSKCKNEKDREDYFKQVKKYIINLIKCKGDMKMLYKFTDKTPKGETGRLFCGNSIQGISKDIRGFLCEGETTDIDMSNAHPTILEYICKKHNIICPNLQYFNRNRALCWDNIGENAKTVFLIAVNDNKRQPKIKDKFFKEFDKEMKRIQAELMYIDEFDDIVKSVPPEKSRNYLGSAINRILCVYENEILGKIINKLNSLHFEICALMFDGLMIYGNHYDNEELLKTLEIETEEYGIKLKYKQHETCISSEDLKVLPIIEDRLYASTDIDAGELILKMICPLVNDCGFYMKQENVWVQDKEIIDNYLLEFILKANIYKKGKDGFPDIPYSHNIKNAKNIREVVYCVCPREELRKKFHTTMKGKVAFKNGILDFKTKELIPWNEAKVETCICIKRDYTKSDEAHIQELKKMIFEPLFGKKMNMAGHFLSRAMAGHFEDKNWTEYIGNRSCGKGVIYDGLKASFGDYINTFELGNMLYNRKTAGMETNDCSKKLYWLLDLEFTRLAISQETPPSESELKVSGKILKKIAGGGDEIVARRNYDRFDTHFTLDTTFMIMGNNSIECDATDCMEKCVSFSSIVQFKTQTELEEIKRIAPQEISRYRLADPKIKEMLKTDEWANVLVNILLDYYTDIPVPVLRSDYEEYTPSLINLVRQKYEITSADTDEVLCDDMFLQFKDKKKITSELESVGVIKKKVKRGTNRDRMVFVGLKEIKEEMETFQEL